ncbi:hypothetical protein E2562_035566 [Oryza meyeriana var. granulata]|uniref:Uncharacterized protein n=1 Tax=Oryza meyeriana var. granulata TaxID=110450 RepID=A0A6G1DTB7_9ORYZ|nr:hypothetical protein E2562_035566 [Oryza meyeriana var. granulata]
MPPCGHRSIGVGEGDVMSHVRDPGDQGDTETMMTPFHKQHDTMCTDDGLMLLYALCSSASAA